MPPYIRHLRLVPPAPAAPPTLPELLEQRAALLEAQVRTVVGLGLLDATNSKAARSGTAHRLACAESAGLAVQRFSWGLAPAVETKGEAA